MSSQTTKQNKIPSREKLSHMCQAAWGFQNIVLNMHYDSPSMEKNAAMVESICSRLMRWWELYIVHNMILVLFFMDQTYVSSKYF